jgi:L-ascorbate metabolism protein UlaG (beta-lactamase superfamily)
MQLTKLGHACVRINTGNAVIVIDPGAFSEPDAADGADVVLITHEHFDHVVPEQLRAAAEQNADLEIWAAPAVAAQFPDLKGRIHAVTHGDSFEVAGTPVHVYGERHANIYRDLPGVDNVGFLVGGEVFHPGDALTVPEEKVRTLLAPAGAPWLKLAELIDYVQEVAPDRAHPIHDGLFNDTGMDITMRWLTQAAGAEGRDISRLVPGEPVTLS